MAKDHTIGIDLGTSNCALALALPDSIQVLPVPQISGQDRISEESTFASALYIPWDKQFTEGSINLPWSTGNEKYLAGNFARETGARMPDRLITSAKSWLCQGTIDPRKPVLPWDSKTVKDKLSPLEVSRYFLTHLRNAFLMKCSEFGVSEDLASAQVVLTVPASFDEAARTVTAQAAVEAGWGENTVLLEEPQAAFYSWLHVAGNQWRDQVAPGELILICDVGGGTTDFSLIAVGEHEGNLELERISVGRHVLLGGDNMDLALAHALRMKLEEENESIESNRFLALIHSTRKAKESLFEKEDLDEIQVAVASSGSDLFAGTSSTTLTRNMLTSVVLDGFFPLTGADDLPAELPRTGLHEFGLSYEPDPVISKHLARFLTASLASVKSSESLSELVTISDKQRLDKSWLCPDAAVFNGGVFRAAPLRRRVLDLINSWAPQKEIRELAGTDLDLAVARGAALYGRLKTTGKGVRIRAGVSRSYYIGLEPSMPAIPGYRPPVKAVCVAELGMEEGEERILQDRLFGLVAGTTSMFRFFSSSQRAGDRVGSIIQNAEKELEETAGLEMLIPAEEGKEPGHTIPVKLHTVLSELGMLRLWMQHTITGKKWELTFSVRDE
ncbi:MAG: Hsp70 family protein [Chitinivibrionales bacterium]|nr:Hsp70 family protein [Chitinivibrionales bacterium]